MCPPLPLHRYRGSIVDLDDRIIDVVRATRRFLTTSDVSRAVDVNPRTVERVLELLAGEGVVRRVPAESRTLWGATPSTPQEPPP